MGQSHPPSASPLGSQVFLEQLRLLYSGLPISQGIALGFATLIVIVQWQDVQHDTLLAWYALLVIAAAWRLLTGWRFRHATDPAVRSRRWYGLFLAGVLAGGLLWALPAFWRFDEYRFSEQNFILLMIVGMCAGAITTLSYRREAVPVFILPVIGASFLRLIAEGTLAAEALAFALVLYLLGLLLSARHIHHITLQNILLNLETRKQQRLLLHNEQRLQFLLDVAADAFFLHDEKGRIVDVNREACHSLGYTREELLNLLMADIVPTLTGHEFIWNSLTSDHSLTVEGLHRRKDGSTYPVELRFSMFEEGGHRYFPVLARDTTERQLAQRRIKASEELARAQFKGIPVPTYTWKHTGSDFVLIDYNDAAEAATHGNIGNWVGAKLSEMYRDEPEIREDIHRCFRTQEPLSKAMSYRLRATHEQIRLSVKYAFIAPDLVMVHAEDVTKQVEALEQLRYSRERLADAQRTAKLGDWEWDLTTGRIDWSEEIFRIFELDPATTAVSQELFMSAVYPDDIKLVEASTARAFQGECFFDEEWRIVTHRGVLKYIHLRGERFFDADRQPVRMVGTLQDVSDRKQAEISKQDFVSVVSHELRTPLTSIIGSLSILRSNLLENDSQQAQELVRIAADNSQRLLRLVNDLLDASRIDAGKMAFNYEDIPLAPFVEQAVHANEGYARNFGVSLSMEDRLEETVRVRGDRMRLMQVMDNLISNAIKFSPGRGTVRILVDRYSGRIRIRIEDRGPGIPEEFRDNIFQKFSRLDSSNTRTTGGTGLGLHISKYIVERHGGEIGFDNNPDGGSTFHVTLDTVTQAAASEFAETR